MKGKPVVIRTLDIGADKVLNAAARDSLGMAHGKPTEESNPALGLRAIRYCLAYPELFLTQLRAILRASSVGTVRILVPMLAHVHEIDQAMAFVARAKEQLKERKQKFDARVPVGGMIEVPAAALSLPAFVKRLKFLSLGTNDLIQYTLAIDRADAAVAHLYDQLHPAVLQLVARTIKTGEKARVPTAVCGEMAGEIDMTGCCSAWGSSSSACIRRRSSASRSACCRPRAAPRCSSRQASCAPTTRSRCAARSSVACERGPRRIDRARDAMSGGLHGAVRRPGPRVDRDRPNAYRSPLALIC